MSSRPLEDMERIFMGSTNRLNQLLLNMKRDQERAEEIQEEDCKSVKGESHGTETVPATKNPDTGVCRSQRKSETAG